MTTEHKYDLPETNERVWFDVFDSATWFKGQMLAKLWEHRQKRFWLGHPDFDMQDAVIRLDEERIELQTAIADAMNGKGEWGEVVRECADIANFCMMVAQMAAVLDNKDPYTVQYAKLPASGTAEPESGIPSPSSGVS